MSENSLERRKITKEDILKFDGPDTLGGMLDQNILKRAQEIRVMKQLQEDIKNLEVTDPSDRNAEAFRKMKERYYKKKKNSNPK